MNDIIYNGTSLRDLGFAIKKHPIHSVAERDIEFVSAIGHSGDFIVDNNCYKNVEIPPYEINMIDFDRLQNTDENERKLIDWLLTGDGKYKRFEDSTVPGYFCKAICTSIGELNRNDIDGFLETTIQFTREPFWYLNEGQNLIEFDASREDTIIINPEGYYSLPYFKITAKSNQTPGEFDLVVNGSAYKIKEFSLQKYIELDSETANVFVGNIDWNQYSVFDYFPLLKPGENTISIQPKASGSQGISPFDKVQVIPRWRRL